MLKKFEAGLENLSCFSYIALRIMAGFMFTFHGVQKIFGIYSTYQPEFLSQIWVGGLIELVCGIAIFVGIQTRLAAFLSSGTMAVAYIQFHWKFQFGDKFFPAINEGELAALYCFVFLYIACKGSGRTPCSSSAQCTSC